MQVKTPGSPNIPAITEDIIFIKNEVRLSFGDKAEHNPDKAITIRVGALIVLVSTAASPSTKPPTILSAAPISLGLLKHASLRSSRVTIKTMLLVRVDTGTPVRSLRMDNAEKVGKNPA